MLGSAVFHISWFSKSHHKSFTNNQVERETVSQQKSRAFKLFFRK